MKIDNEVQFQLPDSVLNNMIDITLQALNNKALQDIEQVTMPSFKTIGVMDTVYRRSLRECISRAMKRPSRVSEAISKCHETVEASHKMNLRYKEIFEQAQKSEGLYRRIGIYEKSIFDSALEGFGRKSFTQDDKSDITPSIATQEAFAEKMGANQFVCWSVWPKCLMDEIIESNNIIDDILIRTWDENLEANAKMIKRILKHLKPKANKKRFKGAIKAFEKGNYDIAIDSLFSILDGTLANMLVSTETSIHKRVKSMMERSKRTLNSQGDMLRIFEKTILETAKSLGAHSRFDKEEPKNLNRHWIVHGRSNRKISKLDCIKLIRLLYGLVLLDDLSVQ